MPVSLMVHQFNNELDQSLTTNHRKISIFYESHVFLKKTAGLHHTEDRIGMHQTPISNQNPSNHPIIDFLRSAAEAAACKFD